VREKHYSLAEKVRLISQANRRFEEVKLQTLAGLQEAMHQGSKTQGS
jgi:hypothetical protein